MTGGSVAYVPFDGPLVEIGFASLQDPYGAGCRDQVVADCVGSAILIGSDGSLRYCRQVPGSMSWRLIHPPCVFIDQRDTDAEGLVVLDLAAFFREPVDVVGRDG